MATQISVAEDFSLYPAGRYPADGPFSGQKFRKMIKPVVDRGDHLVVRLDGTLGYGASFLEEAFGGLVKETGMTFDEFKSRVEIITEDPNFQFYCDMSYKFAEQAANETQIQHND